jgi:hypothetical protein
MKIGDLVKLKGAPEPRSSGTTGVIVKIFEKKCWRTQDLGPMIDWRKIDPEPHADVMLNAGVMSFPVAELELVK